MFPYFQVTTRLQFPDFIEKILSYIRFLSQSNELYFIHLRILFRFYQSVIYINIKLTEFYITLQYGMYIHVVCLYNVQLYAKYDSFN